MSPIQKLRERISQRTIRSSPKHFQNVLETNHSEFQNRFALDPDGRLLPMIDPYQAAKMPNPDWLVEGVIPKSSLVFLYGREGIGKSFMLMDLAFSVASGANNFLGFPVKNAGSYRTVFYVSAEGAAGLGNRVVAWAENKYDDGCDGLSSLHCPLYLIPAAPQLNTDLGRAQLLLNLRLAEDPQPALIILDTLHALTATANENAAEEMGAFLLFLNELRQLSGATIVVAHHARKTPGPGSNMRGTSALSGAADAMINLTAEESGNIVVSCEKQKDWAPFQEFQAVLKIVKLKSRAGQTSCILERLVDLSSAEDGQRNGKDPSSPRKPVGRPPSREAETYAVLAAHMKPLTAGEWHRASGLPQSTFYKCLQALIVKGTVRYDIGTKLYYADNAKPLFLGGKEDCSGVTQTGDSEPSGNSTVQDLFNDQP